MSERLKRLNQLLGLKQIATQKAAANWRIVNDQYLAGKSRHDQLVSYRNDYAMQLNELGQEGCSYSRLQIRIGFIQTLDGALGNLNQQLASIATRRTELQKKYLSIKTSEDSVSHLIEKVKSEEKLKQEKQEQKESDEYAQKQWYSNTYLTSKSNPSE